MSMAKVNKNDRRRSFSKSDLVVFRQLLRYLRPTRGLFAIGFIALLFASVLNLLVPEIVRRMLEPAAYQTVLNYPFRTVLFLLCVFAFQGLFTFVRYYSFTVVGQRVLAEVRKDLFASLIRQDIATMDLAQSNDLTSRLINDAALVQDAVSIRLSVVIRYSVQVVVGILCMMWLSLTLTLATAGSILVLVAISFALAKGLRRLSREQQDCIGDATVFASENLSSVRTIRALEAENHVGESFARHVEQIRGIGIKRAQYAGMFASGMSFLLYSLLSALLVFGITLVSSNRLQVSELAAFVLYGAIVAASFSFLISGYTELVQSLGGLSRVFELITTPEHQSNESPKGIAPIGIRLVDVSFTYSVDRQYVIRDLDIVIQPESTTALVGISGSGKSSLVGLILGFYESSKGRISFFERGDIEVDRQSVSIGWAPQEPVLFSVSVEENLRYANPSASSNDLKNACRAAGCLDLIEALPEGFSSKIGEKGVALSGGQRQRISIARALLRSPQVLILDEATSGLDSGTEEAIASQIRAFLPTVTILLISHRLATVKRADSIVVIDSGRVVQSGTHRQLTTEEGPYKDHAFRQSLEH